MSMGVLSCVWFFANPWAIAHQAPMSLGFPRQEYWSGLSFLSPGDFSWPRDQTHVPCIAGGFFFNHWATRKAQPFELVSANVRPHLHHSDASSSAFWCRRERVRHPEHQTHYPRPAHPGRGLPTTLRIISPVKWRSHASVGNECDFAFLSTKRLMVFIGQMWGCVLHVTLPIICVSLSGKRRFSMGKQRVWNESL